LGDPIREAAAAAEREKGRPKEGKRRKEK